MTESIIFPVVLQYSKLRDLRGIEFENKCHDITKKGHQTVKYT